MNRDQFIQALRKHARKTGKSIDVDKSKGKGSHYWVSLDGRETVVQHKLNPGRIQRILKQLGLSQADL